MSQISPTSTEIDAYASAYVLKDDQTAAFRKAYPSSKAVEATLWSKASIMHKKKQVQERIAQLRDTSRKAVEEEFGLSVSRITQMLASAAAQGLKLKVDAQANKIPVNLSATVSALNEINKMNGNHAAVKSELAGKDGADLVPSLNFSALSSGALKEILAARAEPNTD